MRSILALIGLMLSVTLPAPEIYFWIFVVLVIAAIIMDITDAFA